MALAATTSADAAACSTAALRRRCLMSWVLLFVVTAANLMQHHLPAPVPNAWWDEDGLDMGKHEVQLRQYAGVWVYLTAQILCILFYYHVLSAVATTWGWPERAAYGSSPVCLGLAVVVYSLYMFFWVLMTFFAPRWRDQWTYYERLGYPYEKMMHVMHNPIWLCPAIDAFYVKDRRKFALHVPGAAATAACVASYIAFYASFTTWNFWHTACYVYAWMYEIDRSGYGALGHVAYYATLSVPIVPFVLVVRARLLAVPPPAPKVKAG